MTQPSLTPKDLRDNPDYAVLTLLLNTLHVVRRSLARTYWRLEDDVEDVGDVTLPEEAFAMAMMNQIQALQETVECYFKRIEWYQRAVARAQRESTQAT